MPWGKRINSSTSVLILYATSLDVFPLEMAADEMRNLCDLHFKFYSRWEAQEDGGTASGLGNFSWFRTDTELSSCKPGTIKHISNQKIYFRKWQLWNFLSHQSIDLLGLMVKTKLGDDTRAVLFHECFFYFNNDGFAGWCTRPVSRCPVEATHSFEALNSAAAPAATHPWPRSLAARLQFDWNDNNQSVFVHRWATTWAALRQNTAPRRLFVLCPEGNPEVFISTCFSWKMPLAEKNSSVSWASPRQAEGETSALP